MSSAHIWNYRIHHHQETCLQCSFHDESVSVIFLCHLWTNASTAWKDTRYENVCVFRCRLFSPGAKQRTAHEGSSRKQTSSLTASMRNTLRSGLKAQYHSLLPLRDNGRENVKCCMRKCHLALGTNPNSLWFDKTISFGVRKLWGKWGMTFGNENEWRGFSTSSRVCGHQFISFSCACCVSFRNQIRNPSQCTASSNPPLQGMTFVVLSHLSDLFCSLFCFRRAKASEKRKLYTYFGVDAVWISWVSGLMVRNTLTGPLKRARWRWFGVNGWDSSWCPECWWSSSLFLPQLVFVDTPKWLVHCGLNCSWQNTSLLNVTSSALPCGSSPEIVHVCVCPAETMAYLFAWLSKDSRAFQS